MSKFLSPIRWRFIIMLGFAAGVYFFANLHRVAIPGAVFDQLQERWACQAPGIAGLGAAFMYIYAAMQPLTGLLLDRYGSGRILLGGGTLFITGMLCFANAPSLWRAYIAQILCGLGAGSIYLAVVKENMRTFRDKYNITLAVIVLIGYAGGVTANAPLLMTVEKIGLSKTLALNALIAFVFLFGIIVLLPKRFQGIHKDRRFSAREFLPVFKQRHNCHLYIFSAINFALFYVLQTVIGKKFLLDFCNMPDLAAGWVFSATGAVAAVSGLSMAALSHLLGNRRKIFCRTAGVISFGSFSIILLLTLCNVRVGAVYAGFFILLSATASLSSILIPLLRETNGNVMMGKTVSMLNFSFYLCVAFFGNMAGVILKCFTPMERNGITVYGQAAWSTIFGIFACAALLVLFYSFKMRETYGKTVLNIDER